MLVAQDINLLIVICIVIIEVLQARPPFSTERIVIKQIKRNVTVPSKQVDCGNILMLIDSQIDLFKCLLQTYKDDVRDIVFPNSEESNEANDFLELVPQIHGIPACAKNGDTFCENIDNYPYDKVQTLIKQNNSISAAFGVDASPDMFINRVSSDEEFLCEDEHKLIFPKLGKTKNNMWQYIVNQDLSPEGYIQGIRIETCKNSGGRCKFAESIPGEYITSCKQKYMYRKLLSITNQGTVYDFFELPSACCCSYRRDIKFLLRFGGPMTSSRKKH